MSISLYIGKLSHKNPKNSKVYLSSYTIILNDTNETNKIPEYIPDWVYPYIKTEPRMSLDFDKFKELTGLDINKAIIRDLPKLFDRENLVYAQSWEQDGSTTIVYSNEIPRHRTYSRVVYYEDLWHTRAHLTNRYYEDCKSGVYKDCIPIFSREEATKFINKYWEDSDRDKVLDKIDNLFSDRECIIIIA